MKPGKPLGFPQSAVLKVLAILNNCVTLPLMKWVAKTQFQPVERTPPGAYVEAAGPITPLVVMAAQAETLEASQACPIAFQAELNACMEAIRADSLKGGMITMFGSLIGAGYPPDEALVRVCANFLQLGMYLERATSDRKCAKCGAVLLALPECPHCGAAIQDQAS